ncbi:MAG: FkbM family methyltransferase, partial [Acidilobus sp.]
EGVIGYLESITPTDKDVLIKPSDSSAAEHLLRYHGMAATVSLMSIRKECIDEWTHLLRGVEISVERAIPAIATECGNLYHTSRRLTMYRLHVNNSSVGLDESGQLRVLRNYQRAVRDHERILEGISRTNPMRVAIANDMASAKLSLYFADRKLKGKLNVKAGLREEFSTLRFWCRLNGKPIQSCIYAAAPFILPVTVRKILSKAVRRYRTGIRVLQASRSADLGLWASLVGLARRSFKVTCKGLELNLSLGEMSALGDLLKRDVAGYKDCAVTLYADGTKVTVPLREIIESKGGIATIRKAVLHGWRFMDGRWTKNGISFVHMHEEILSTFEDEEYSFLDVSGKPVIDVGAYVGDTALYFVRKGASKVIALEPSPGAFKELTDNVKINGLDDRVVAINAAIGEPGTVPISKEASYVRSAASHWVGEPNGDRPKDISGFVKAIRLSELVKLYKVYNAVLKADCEGCEYYIAMHDPESLASFDEIGLEYHVYNTGVPVSELINAISAAGFACERVNDWVYLKNAGGSWNSEMIGELRCVKRR